MGKAKNNKKEGKKKSLKCSKSMNTEMTNSKNHGKVIEFKEDKNMENEKIKNETAKEKNEKSIFDIINETTKSITDAKFEMANASYKANQIKNAGAIAINTVCFGSMLYLMKHAIKNASDQRVKTALFSFGIASGALLGASIGNSINDMIEIKQYKDNAFKVKESYDKLFE